jgi:pimeloyl-ACP methyl ester carboxylesterase
MSELLARGIGARFHLLPGCGHVPYVEAHEAFTSLLDDFLPCAP